MADQVIIVVAKSRPKWPNRDILLKKFEIRRCFIKKVFIISLPSLSWSAFVQFQQSRT